MSSPCVHVCLHVASGFHQCVGPVTVGVLKADWGWFLCVLRPLSLHPSVLHPLHSANPREKQKQGERKKRNLGLWWVKHSTEKKSYQQAHTEAILKIHIPQDRNIHALVSWCTGAGRSVSATRQWSDYSCLNSKCRRDSDYIPAHTHTHMLVQVSEKSANERVVWLLENSQPGTQAELFALQQLQYVTPTC